MPRSSAEEQARTRKALLEAAIDEIEERPLHEVTLEDVAKRAGYTKGAIYSNFNSRNELLISVLEHGRDLASDHYSPIVESEPLDRLVELAQVVVPDARYGSLAHLRISSALRAAAIDDPELALRLVEHETIARDQLKASLETIAERFDLGIPVDLDTLATSILSMSTMLYMRAAYNPAVDPAKMFAEMLQLLLEGAIAMTERSAGEASDAT